MWDGPGAPGSSEYYIELNGVETKPTTSRDIRVLETALAISTILDPEIASVLKNPIEGTFFIRELSIAVGVIARYVAGYSISTIINELGVSEQRVSSLINKKTMLSRLVFKQLEKIEAGEIKKLVLPLRPVAECIDVSKLKGEYDAKISALENQLKIAEETVSRLEAELKTRQDEIEKLTKELKDKISQLESLNMELIDAKSKLENCEKNRGDTEAELKRTLEVLSKQREVLLTIKEKLKTIVEIEAMINSALS